MVEQGIFQLKSQLLALVGAALMSTLGGLCRAAGEQTIPPGNLAGDAGAVQLHLGEHFDPYAGGGPPAWDRGPIARGPTAAAALEGVQAALRACGSVAAAVLDTAGQPRATEAADGIRGWHIYSATRKALTAVALREPSSKAIADAAADPTVAAKLGANMTTLAGAVPIWSKKEFVGAIGVSGGRSGEEDEKCAVAGAAAVEAALK
jgi:glc operon protein GlcG